jgi:hypothetical protein
MADTSTTNYSLTKPEVGASEDTWGTKLNTNLDTLDTTIKSVSDVANAALPKAGGSVTGDITTTANINLGDNDKAQFGASQDLQIYHDGSNSYVSDQGTGSLNILATDQIKLGNSDNTEVYAKFNNNGNVELRHNNSVRLETTADGVDITGTGALKLPVGTTAQQPSSPTAGDLRWNSDDTSAEIYDGSAWGSVGGGGAAETPYAEHSNNITEAYSIASGNNAVSGGPITVGTGGSVTVPTGSTWTIV